MFKLNSSLNSKTTRCSNLNFLCQQETDGGCAFTVMTRAVSTNILLEGVNKFLDTTPSTTWPKSRNYKERNVQSKKRKAIHR